MKVSFILAFIPVLLFAQDDQSLDQNARQDSAFAPQSTYALADQIDVDFLFNYYDQEGNNSAVTGGLGTEELNDYSSIIQVYIPLDSQDWVSINSGINVYTSASTDRIDTRISSASFRDARARMFLTYHKGLKNKQYLQFQGGGSVESDYISSSFGIGWGTQSKDLNRDLYLGFHSYQDSWMLIFPDELRDTGRDIAPTSRRRSYSLTAVLSQVINPKLNISLASDLVFQTGMLATPFHRVYFEGDAVPFVEKLPTSRLKWPIALRANYTLSDWLIARGFYRFYADNFGILAHSAQAEFAIKFSQFFRLYPSYRFHTQSASMYFEPFGVHQADAEFYTSDFDLSAFSSHKLSLSLHYAPLYGIGRFKFVKKRIGLFDEIELRYARYWRNTGLQAHLLGLQLGFKL